MENVNCEENVSSVLNSLKHYMHVYIYNMCDIIYVKGPGIIFRLV